MKLLRGVKEEDEKVRIRRSFGESRDFRGDLNRVLLHEIEVLRKDLEGDEILEGPNYAEKCLKKLSIIKAYKSITYLLDVK